MSRDSLTLMESSQRDEKTTPTTANPLPRRSPPNARPRGTASHHSTSAPNNRPPPRQRLPPRGRIPRVDRASAHAGTAPASPRRPAGIHSCARHASPTRNRLHAPGSRVLGRVLVGDGDGRGTVTGDQRPDRIGDIFSPGTAQDAAHQFAATSRFKGVWNAVCECGEVVGQCLPDSPRTVGGIPQADEHQACPYCGAVGPEKIKYQFQPPEPV